MPPPARGREGAYQPFRYAAKKPPAAPSAPATPEAVHTRRSNEVTRAASAAVAASAALCLLCVWSLRSTRTSSFVMPVSKVPRIRSNVERPLVAERLQLAVGNFEAAGGRLEAALHVPGLGALGSAAFPSPAAPVGGRRAPGATLTPASRSQLLEGARPVLLPPDPGGQGLRIAGAFLRQLRDERLTQASLPHDGRTPSSAGTPSYRLCPWWSHPGHDEGPTSRGGRADHRARVSRTPRTSRRRASPAGRPAWCPVTGSGCTPASWTQRR